MNIIYLVSLLYIPISQKCYYKTKKRRRKHFSFLFLPKSRASFSRLLQVKMFRSRSCREEMRSSSMAYKYHCLANGGTPEAEAPPSPTYQQLPVMLRSYSTSTYSPHKNPTPVRDNPNSKSKRSISKVKKGLKEADLQRKKRVAAYNVYCVEGKVKGSIRNYFKWFKETCSNAVNGLW